MDLQLKALTALTEDPNSVPSAHARQATTNYNSSSKESNIFWTPVAPTLICTYPDIDIQILDMILK